MKKILLVVAAVLFTVNAFCGPFTDLIPSDLNENQKAVSAGGSIPAGKEILPVLQFYSENMKPADKKILEQKLIIHSADFFENKYDLIFSYSYKVGFVTAVRIAKMNLVADAANFTVNMTSLVNAAGDSRTNCSSRDMKATVEQFVSDFNDVLNSMTAAEYSAYFEKAFINLQTFVAVNKQNINKLKAKKWFEAHNPEGKIVTEKLLVTDVEESDLEGFAYKVNAYGGLSEDQMNYEDSLGDKNALLNGIMAGGIKVSYYCNDDKILDVKNNSILEISGKITKANFIEKEYYRLTSVVIEE